VNKVAKGLEVNTVTGERKAKIVCTIDQPAVR